MESGAVSAAAKPTWKVELTRLTPYLIGVGILFPALELLAVDRLAAASTSDVEASGLVTAWQVTIFLLVLLVPLFLNRSVWNNLKARSIIEGAGRVLGLLVVSLLLSLVLAPGSGTDTVLNVINFHIFLLTFCLLLASVFYLTQGLGLGGTGGQVAGTIVGLAMIGTVLYFNPLIEGEAVGEGVRELSTRICIGANPVIVSFHNFLGVDFFHIESVYKFSALSGYPYQYPSWGGVAGTYCVAAVGFLLTGILAYYLRVVLPENLMQRRIQENRELKSSKISSLRETGESAFTFTAPATIPPPAEGQPFDPTERSGPTILESLFENPPEPEGEGGEPQESPEGGEGENATDWMNVQIESAALPTDEAGPEEAPPPASEEGDAYVEPTTEAVSSEIEEQALDLGESEAPKSSGPPAEDVGQAGPEPAREPYREMETRDMTAEELHGFAPAVPDEAEESQTPEPYREMETRDMTAEELHGIAPAVPEEAEESQPPEPYREMDTRDMSAEELKDAMAPTGFGEKPKPPFEPYRETETRDMSEVVGRFAADESDQLVGPASQVSGFEPYREMETRDMTGEIQPPSDRAADAQPAEADEAPPEEALPEEPPTEEEEPPSLSPDTPILPKGETSRLGTIVDMFSSADDDLDEPLADRAPPEDGSAEDKPEQGPGSPPRRMDTDRLGTLVDILSAEDSQEKAPPEEEEDTEDPPEETDEEPADEPGEETED